MLVEDLVQYLGFSKSYQKSYASHISRQTFKKKRASHFDNISRVPCYHEVVGKNYVSKITRVCTAFSTTVM